MLSLFSFLWFLSALQLICIFSDIYHVLISIILCVSFRKVELPQGGYPFLSYLNKGKDWMSICWTSGPHWWFLQHWLSLVFNCKFKMTITHVLHNDMWVSMDICTVLHFPWITFSYKIHSSPWIMNDSCSIWFSTFFPTCPHFQVKVFGILIIL